jgi:hypothetical protein
MPHELFVKEASLQRSTIVIFEVGMKRESVSH